MRILKGRIKSRKLGRIKYKPIQLLLAASICGILLRRRLMRLKLPACLTLILIAVSIPAYTQKKTLTL
jgi:hypothetical protein